METLALEVARRVKERLLQAFPRRILEIRVFGSRARGDARADSDLDLFIKVDSRDSHLDDAIHAAAWDVGQELGLIFAVSPRIMSEEHFNKLLHLERLIARDILNEGVLV